MTVLVGFQPGESPSRGLLCDCEIFGNLPRTIVCSAETGVPILARLPLDPVIGKSCDQGENIFNDEELSHTKVVTAYSDLATRILQLLSQ